MKRIIQHPSQGVILCTPHGPRRFTTNSVENGTSWCRFYINQRCKALPSPAK